MLMLCHQRDRTCGNASSSNDTTGTGCSTKVRSLVDVSINVTGIFTIFFVFAPVYLFNSTLTLAFCFAFVNYIVIPDYLVGGFQLKAALHCLHGPRCAPSRLIKSETLYKRCLSRQKRKPGSKRRPH